MKNQALKQIVRALGAAALTLLSSLALYDQPPSDWAALWQPSIQAGIVFLGALGINRVTRAPQWEPVIQEQQQQTEDHL